MLDVQLTGKRAFRILLPVLLFAACASRPGDTGGNFPETDGKAEKAAETVSPARTANDNLDSVVFQDLPPEAKNYLASLSKAFRTQDEGFLIAQGEKQFEADLKGLYDAGGYLALLYRAGPYSRDAPRINAGEPGLDLALIHHIEYTSWKERGPMLEIQGKLVTKTGETIPCGIVLAWRLAEPKILGVYP
jgi:hypothetical protein